MPGDDGDGRKSMPAAEKRNQTSSLLTQAMGEEDGEKQKVAEIL